MRKRKSTPPPQRPLLDERYIAERARRADIPKALSILKRAGAVRRPVKGDEMPKKR